MLVKCLRVVQPRATLFQRSHVHEKAAALRLLTPRCTARLPRPRSAASRPAAARPVPEAAAHVQVCQREGGRQEAGETLYVEFWCQRLEYTFWHYIVYSLLECVRNFLRLYGVYTTFLAPER